MIQASHTTVTEAIERTYAALRPTVYRPSELTGKRIDSGAQNQAGIARAVTSGHMRRSDLMLTVHRA